LIGRRFAALRHTPNVHSNCDALPYRATCGLTHNPIRCVPLVKFELGETNMDFISFLILLIISGAVSAFLHYFLEYYVTPGPWSFASKVVVGWFGAWLGTPVFGRWFPGFNYSDVYFIPAILGAFAILVVAVDLMKMTNKSGANGTKGAKRR
jgi:uncharacterized membrane protein YeaQ/YmgE (transglycosylase-associated protein family)